MKNIGLICWILILAGCASQRGTPVSCADKLQPINVAGVSAVGVAALPVEKKPDDSP